MVIDLKLIFILCSNEYFLFQIISVILQRCSPLYAKKFVNKFKGFYQMANILALHQTTVNLIDTCASIFTSSYWLPLDQQLQWDQSVEMSSFNFPALPLLLSLLPKSAFNLTLCTSIVNFFLKLVTKVCISIYISKKLH